MCGGEQSQQQSAPTVDVDAIAQRVVELMEERSEATAPAGEVVQEAQPEPAPAKEPKPNLPSGGYARYSAIANEQ